MKKLFKKVLKRIRKWNDYWAFIEQERINAMKYCGRGFF